MNINYSNYSNILYSLRLENRLVTTRQFTNFTQYFNQTIKVLSAGVVVWITQSLFRILKPWKTCNGIRHIMDDHTRRLGDGCVMNSILSL